MATQSETPASQMVEEKVVLDEQARKASLYTAHMANYLEEQGIFVEEVLPGYRPIYGNLLSQVVMRSIKTKTILDEDPMTHNVKTKYLDEWLDPATVFRKMRVDFEDSKIGNEEAIEAVRWVRFYITKTMPFRIHYTINEAPKWVQNRQAAQGSKKRPPTRDLATHCIHYVDQMANWLNDFANVKSTYVDISGSEAHKLLLGDAPDLWPGFHKILDLFKQKSKNPLQRVQMFMRPTSGGTELLWNCNEECADEPEVAPPALKRARPASPTVSQASCVEVGA